MRDYKNDIYFSLTNKQRVKLNQSQYLMFEIPVSEFLKITKNKDIIKLLVEYKRSRMRLIA